MQKNILVYAGPGTGKDSVKYSAQAFQKLSPKAKVEKITAASLLKGEQLNEAGVFIMPGGADLPYVKKLNGIGNKLIRKFVENGGIYIGICAGSYYAGDSVEFAKGDKQLEVIGNRELKLFPNKVKGPVFPGFDYNSYAGARVLDVVMEDGKKLTTFYNGGGYFVGARKAKNVEVLASYDLPRKPAAIIKCKVGKGIALLSGVHFEYNPCDLAKLIL